MDLTSALLKGSEYAVRQYNKMSSMMWAPEGYIRDMCAMYVHEQHQSYCRILVTDGVRRQLFETAIWGPQSHR
jgi:hypothetical protein